MLRGSCSFPTLCRTLISVSWNNSYTEKMVQSTYAHWKFEAFSTPCFAKAGPVLRLCQRRFHIRSRQNLFSAARRLHYKERYLQIPMNNRSIETVLFISLWLNSIRNCSPSANTRIIHDNFSVIMGLCFKNNYQAHFGEIRSIELERSDTVGGKERIS